MQRIVLIIITASLALALAGCGAKEADNNVQGGASQAEDSTTKPEETPPVKEWPEMPKMSIDTSKSYEAAFVTSMGEFKVELFAKDAPQTVNSFVFLAREKYFDGLKFHRVIRDFMIQSGDPQGNGMGGPGYNIPDELNNGHTYEEGVVAMANTSQPDSGGSQFFIGSGKDVEGLNNQPIYTIFGKVSEGMETIKAIASAPVGPGNSDMTDSKPVQDITITSITIIEK
ncbi:peptidylprolyl isomerase [Paenibacillus oenotherae]|uniref:peptidylprolyl isomerase n=1 Tax=Paenibacillus oenotherae TaxID=1435645 RepID=UPI003CCECF79